MKKNVFTPLIIAGLSAAFIVICVMVILTRGKNSWVKRKLRIGGLIISLTAMVSMTSFVACCYAPPMFDYAEVTLDEEAISFNEITIIPNSVTKISGYINNVDAYSLKYEIRDSSENIVISDNIKALDGAYGDSGYESFEIPLDHSVLEEDVLYTLDFLDDYSYENSLNFVITGENYCLFENIDLETNQVALETDMHNVSIGKDMILYIAYKTLDNFSFRITDSSDNELAFGDLADSVSNIEDLDSMTFKVPGDIPNGQYNLDIFGKASTEQSSDYNDYIKRFELNIDGKNIVSIDGAYYYTGLELPVVDYDLTLDNTITGSIDNIANESFRFEIIDSNDVVAMEGDLVSDDGSFTIDESDTFQISPTDITTAGTYTLKIINSDNGEETEYTLNVTES